MRSARDIDVGSRRSREKKRLALIFESSAYVHRPTRDHDLRDRKSLIMSRERCIYGVYATSGITWWREKNRLFISMYIYIYVGINFIVESLNFS